MQDLPDGQALADGRYLVKSKLASGGQGHAYLCYDKVTQTEVVVKVYLLPVYQGKHLKDVAIQQLEAESLVLQRIDHPQIVQFVDWFTSSTCAFLVLKRITGNNLRQVCAKFGRPSLALVQDLTLQMCEILAYLHNSTPAIIHRDFTPDNLIIDGQQKLTLIDFTIAEPSGAVSGLPPAGKPAYMPPEQFRGESNLGPPSDIYALGVLGFELLSGRLPFTGRTFAELAVAHTTQPAPLLPNVPSALTDLFERLLAKEPQRRPRAELLMQSLRSIKEGAPPPKLPEVFIDPYAATGRLDEAVRTAVISQAAMEKKLQKRQMLFTILLAGTVFVFTCAIAVAIYMFLL